MMGTSLFRVETDELSVSASYEDGGALFIRFAGSADARAMASIDAVLKQVHGEAVRTSTREVVVDFHDFEFMSSSCFKAFVSWIGTVQDVERAQQYRIRFLSDDAKHWQRRSLGALSCFAVDLVRVDS